jgi:hypothetical protein
MHVRSAENPNVCFNCANYDWDDLKAADASPEPPAIASTERGPAQVPAELEQLLEVEGPSVVECFDATEQARQAIAEAAAKEKQAVPPPQTQSRPTAA